MHPLHLAFAWLLASSLRASLLALAILCLQAALGPWLPARWRYALWLPMLVVLITPILPATPFSIENCFSRRPVTVAIAPAAPSKPIPLALQAPQGAPPPAAPRTQDTRDLLLAAWLLGASIAIATATLGYWQTLRRIRLHRIQPSPALTRAVAAATAQIRLRRPPRLLLSSAIDSPAVTGLLRPTLLLPATFPAGFTDAESRLVLLHELTHLKSLDLPLNWLLSLLQALHWFNPLLWLAFARIRADREAATDARVLRTCARVLSIASADPRADYGAALLKLQAATPRFGLGLPFVGMFEAAGIRSRIRAIGRHRPAHPAWSIAAIAIIAALLLIGATRARSATPAPDPGAEGPQIELDARVMEVPSSLPIHLDGGKIPATLDGRTKTSALIQSDDTPAAFLAKIEGTPGAKTIAMPRVTTRSGMRAIITVGQDWQPDPKTKPILIGQTLNLDPTLRGRTITLAATFNHSALVDMQVVKGLLSVNGSASATGTALLKLSGTTPPLQLQTGITPAPPADAASVARTGKGVVTSTVSATVTLHDGQTLVLTEPEAAAAQRRLLIFITARLINPKGLPAH